MNYNKFLKSKLIKIKNSGFEINRKQIHPILFNFQKDITKWAIRKGKCGIFADTGLGKTLMQLEWARQIVKKEKINILIVAPLAVSQQTVREAKKINLNIQYVSNQTECKKGISITNYERLDKFNASFFDGIVLDESSILKSFTGKIRTKIIEQFKNTRYKLSCTATPSPNDFMELGNQAEFLDIMNRNEMLSMFFVHDGGDTSKWRLKKHARNNFWKWMSGWAAVVTKPSDLGYKDNGFILPELKIHEIIVKTKTILSGMLFQSEAKTLNERLQARRESINERCQIIANEINKTKCSFLVWCDLNKESETLNKLIPNSKEIKGAHKIEYKEQTMMDFSNKKLRVLITKPSIAGFGMNWQHCNQMAFVGLSDSFEKYYQAVRRCWRFGQKNPVDVFLIIGDKEGAVLKNIKRKEKNAMIMIKAVSENTKKYVKENIQSKHQKTQKYSVCEDIILPDFLGKNYASKSIKSKY